MRVLLRTSSNVGQASSLYQKRKRQTGSLSCMLAGLTAVIGLTACAPQKKQPAPPPGKPLTQSQTNLFQKAFDIASAIPSDPHIKSRSQAQRKVISSLIEAGCPVWADELAGNIENWHRGGAYADLAFFYAENGAKEDALNCLQQSEQVASSITTWHRDRIFSRMAQALELLGDTQAVARVTEGIEEQEVAKIHATRSAKVSNEQYQPQMEALQKLFEANNFDLKIRGLEGLSALYGRVYDNPERRSEIDTSLRTSVEEFAPIVKIDLFLDLASIAVSHGDPSTARKWVSESRELFEKAAWRARFGVPVAARIAEHAFKAGDEALTRQMLDSAEATYREKESEIINIFRANTLIPVAEVRAVTGQADHALTLYMQAVEAAGVNPNSRPRAEDLSVICASMAVHGIEPTEALWSALNTMKDALGEPW